MKIGTRERRVPAGALRCLSGLARQSEDGSFSGLSRTGYLSCGRIQSHIHFGVINLFFCKLFMTALITSFMILFLESLLHVFDFPDQMSFSIFTSYKFVSNRTVVLVLE